MATITGVSAPAKSGELLSERIAPGILPKVLGRFDMIAIFVAIVLFAVQGSVVQPAGAAAFVYWILGFVTFLIPGAIVTGQLGLMFPGEGSIYVWTNKALGSFWGFFAGFCAWWPGTLVMVATAVLVVNLLQFFMSLPPFNVVNPLGALWQQGIIILAVIWFSSGLSILRFRVTQNLVNGVFVIYGAAILTVGLAGLAWLLAAIRRPTTSRGMRSASTPVTQPSMVWSSSPCSASRFRSTWASRSAIEGRSPATWCGARSSLWSAISS